MEYEYPIHLKDLDKIAEQLDERPDEHSIAVRLLKIVTDCHAEAKHVLQHEETIKREQVRMMKEYFTRKGKVWLGAIALVLLSSAAYAQTTPVVSPTEVQFTSDDMTSVDGGQQVITEFVFELWAPGTDTTSALPQVQSLAIPKATATPVAGVVNRYRVLLTEVPSLQIPKGPTWVMTVLTRGPGGTARSAISNSFTVPIPVRAPHAVTGVVVARP